MEDLLIVVLAGLAAGAINTIAGGGTLVSFPALLLVGLPPVTANVTSSVGLVTGYLGGALGYREELKGQWPRVLRLGGVSIAGGLIGALTLISAPANSFEALIPYLVLLSCVLLAAQPHLSRYVQRSAMGSHGSDITSRPLLLQAAVLAASIYGSYFGAGLGVLLLAVLGTLIHDDLQRLNAVKATLALIVNLVGVATFVFSGFVDWRMAPMLLVSAFIGGWFGARIARRLRASVLRHAVVAFGTIFSIVLIVR